MDDAGSVQAGILNNARRLRRVMVPGLYRHALDPGEDSAGAACHQDVCLVGKQASNDWGDMFGLLVETEDDFGKTLAQGPVMIHAGKPEVFKREVFETFDPLFGRNLPLVNRFQKGDEVLPIHVEWRFSG